MTRAGFRPRADAARSVRPARSRSLPRRPPARAARSTPPWSGGRSERCGFRCVPGLEHAQDAGRRFADAAQRAAFVAARTRSGRSRASTRSPGASAGAPGCSGCIRISGGGPAARPIPPAGRSRRRPRSVPVIWTIAVSGKLYESRRAPATIGWPRRRGARLASMLYSFRH